MTNQDRLDSPCCGVCRLDDRQTHCLSCGRTVAEIRAWPTADDNRKRAILARLARRAAATAGQVQIR